MKSDKPIPKCTFIFWICWKLTTLLNLIFFRFESYGSENVPQEGGVLLASNHASYIDPVIIGDGCAHRPCHFLAREELFCLPGWKGWLISRLHTHAIKRDSADRRALQVSRHVLNEGHALVLFPEGTRTQDGEFQEAKPGIGWIALNSDCIVIPTYVQGSYEAWPRHAKKFKWTKVRVFYGEPLDLTDLKKKMRFEKSDYETATHRMMEEIKKLKEKAPPLPSK